MYWAWAAFVDIRRDRFHEFPDYESWILSDDSECRSFRQGWAAMGAIMRDPNRYPDPIDSENATVQAIRTGAPADTQENHGN